MQMRCCQSKLVLWVLFLIVIVNITIQAALWGFYYEQPPNGDTCWAVPSWSKGSFSTEHNLWYQGMPGTDTNLAWEDDSDFVSLYVLYVTGVAASALGLALSVKARWAKLTESSLISVASQRMTLMLYFAVAFVVHVITQVCFVRNRCQDHNAHYVSNGEVLVQMQDGRWMKTVGWSDASSTSAAVAKALYLTMVFNGAFLMNTLLQISLLHRAYWMADIRYLRSVKIAKIFVYGSVVVNLLALPATFAMYMKMMDDGVDAIGGEDFGEIVTIVFNVLVGCYAAAHIYVSIVLMVIFIVVMRRFDGHQCSILKVLTCTCAVILSTLICYGNMVVMIANAYKTLPVDALVNHTCMIILNFTGSFKGEFTSDGEGQMPESSKDLEALQDGIAVIMPSFCESLSLKSAVADPPIGPLYQSVGSIKSSFSKCGSLRSVGAEPQIGTFGRYRSHSQSSIESLVAEEGVTHRLSDVSVHLTYSSHHTPYSSHHTPLVADEEPTAFVPCVIPDNNHMSHHSSNGEDPFVTAQSRDCLSHASSMSCAFLEPADEEPTAFAPGAVPDYAHMSHNSTLSFSQRLAAEGESSAFVTVPGIYMSNQSGISCTRLASGDNEPSAFAPDPYQTVEVQSCNI